MCLPALFFASPVWPVVVAASVNHFAHDRLRTSAANTRILPPWLHPGDASLRAFASSAVIVRT